MISILLSCTGLRIAPGAPICCMFALPALTAAIGPGDEITSAEWMASLAMRLTGILRRGAFTPPCVLAVCDQLHVADILASSVPAQMVGFQTSGDGADPVFISPTMGNNDLLAIPELPIAISKACCPSEAITFGLDLAPEPLEDGGPWIDSLWHLTFILAKHTLADKLLLGGRRVMLIRSASRTS